MNEQKIMEQAVLTAGEYLVAARRHIDAAFGEGYAERNPVLVAAFIQAAASDYAANLAKQAE